MQAKRAIGMMLALGIFGCGSSSSQAPEAGAPVSDAGLRDSTSPSDQAVPSASDASPGSDAVVVSDRDGSVADTVPGEGGAVADLPGAVPDATPVGADARLAPDTVPASDGTAAADVAPLTDAPLGEEAGRNDSTPAASPDGGSVTASTTTPDNPAEPTICSTVVLGQRDLASDQTYDIVVPDCLRVSGTVTLASPLPDGAVYSNGEVSVFKLIKDASGQLSDTVVYGATVTPVDDTHFSYSVGVPADSYEVMYTFVTKSSAAPSLTNLPSTASRIGQDHVTVTASIKHDVTLSPINVITRTVTVTGTDSLPSNGGAYSRQVIVYEVNAANTLLVTGMSMSSGAQIPISMWAPNETFTPTLLVQDSPGTTAPFPSGFTSEFKLAAVTPAGDFSLALPATVKISGNVHDPSGSLSPRVTVGVSGTSAVNYYQCSSLDYGTFPDPLFMFPEGSTSSFFAGATSHALYVRSGIRCATYANYAVAVGPGGLPTRSGENTYAYLDDPSPRSSDAVVLTTDVVRDVNVPALGTQVTMQGTVKDARGNPIPYAQLTFNSDAMTDSALANKKFNGGLDVSGTGTYVAHAPAGSYQLWVKLPTASASGPSADAGAPSGGPDASFTLPDLATGTGDCSSLAACCAQLSGTTKTGCETVVATGLASICASYLSTLQLAGSCS